VRFTDIAQEPRNRDRSLLRGLRGRSARVSNKSVSALNCSFVYMINHAKQQGYRMQFVMYDACCHVTANVYWCSLVA
jgi:hypothetical protein